MIVPSVERVEHVGQPAAEPEKPVEEAVAVEAPAAEPPAAAEPEEDPEFTAKRAMLVRQATD